MVRVSLLLAWLAFQVIVLVALHLGGWSKFLAKPTLRWHKSRRRSITHAFQIPFS
jgi:hypothetical protein